MSLFGQTPAVSLFGNNQSNSPSKSLFGNTASQSQALPSLLSPSNSQPPPTQQSGSAFGTSAGQASGGGLFGPTMNQLNQPQQGNSLFGNTNQNQTQLGGGPLGGLGLQNKSSTNMFSNNATQNQQPSSSLFPGTMNQSTILQQQSQPAQNRTPAFGSSARLPAVLSLGQSSQTQTQSVPGVKIDVSNIRGTTRFNDLHEDLQKQIEQIDNFIQQQISFKEQCDALMPAHEQNLMTIPNDVEFVTNKLNTAELALDNDASAVNDSKATAQKDIENAKICFRAIENLKLPQQFHYTGISSLPARNQAAVDAKSPNGEVQQDLIAYFNSQASSFHGTLEQYKKYITEIEDHLQNVELSAISQSQQIMFRQDRDGGRRSTEDQSLELQTVLKQFEAGILGVAERVTELRDSATEVVRQS